MRYSNLLSSSKALSVLLTSALSVTVASGLYAQEIDLVFPFSPVAQGYRCSQGPGGAFSHSGELTRFALDFPAPRETPVVAAGAGIAYTFFDAPLPGFHDESCPQATSRGFGNYVTVDHGNGLFTLYAHLASVADGIDGAAVIAGVSVLGTVNSTGYSCGNHLHFSLHSGDPHRVLESVPLPITRLIAREMPAGEPELFAGEDLHCGPRGIGRFYSSVEQGGDGAYLRFSEGDPGIPGDGIFVDAGGGRVADAFELSTPVALSTMENGLTFALFFSEVGQPFFDALPTIEALDRTGGCRTTGIGLLVFLGDTPVDDRDVLVNGVEGIAYSIPQAAFEQAVARLNDQHPACGFLLEEFSLWAFGDPGPPVLQGTTPSPLSPRSAFPTSILDAAWLHLAEQAFPE